MNRIHQRETFSIVIFGFTAVTAQVVIMRELVMLFYGNELTLGVMLGIWLLWTAAGSGLLPRILPVKNPGSAFVIVQTLIAFLLPSLPLLTRWSRTLLGLSPGEMAGFTAMLIVTVISLAPICLASGMLYTLACRMRQERQTPGAAVAGVYTLEAAGSGLGGLIISLVMLRFLNTALILILFSALNILSVLVLTGRRKLLDAVFLTVIVIAIPFSVKLQNLYDKI